MMAPPKWNIFARELEQILVPKGVKLGQLDDHPTVHLHRELVSRLRDSLTKPKPLVVLNPDDLERVVAAYDLTPEEHLRLKSAMLATAVERVLMGRVDLPTALMAANEVFTILKAAFEAKPDLARQIRAAPFITHADATTPLDDAIDRVSGAMLDLHIALESSPDAMPEEAGQAAQSFMEALAQLRSCPPAEQVGSSWQYWYHEAEAGLSRARRLAEGGA